MISRGEHPEGVQVGAWHSRENPVFNRLQKDSYWRKWLDRACPVACPLSNTDLAAVVADCLQVTPNLRPTLTDIQQRLQSILSELSQAASDQSDLFLREAGEITTPNNWVYLNEQLASLKRTIDKTYPA
jgi:hypothetical protein